MTPCDGEPSGWAGKAGIRLLPPAAYWAHLAERFPPALVGKLKARSELRVGEFDRQIFKPSERADGEALLATFGADGWARCVERYRCSENHDGVTRADFERGVCPRDDGGEILEELAWERELPPTRDVEWAIAIHGMNTRGAWQEEFSWFFGTSQGGSVPVSIYKYGRILTGVVLAFRREELKKDLRRKLVMLQEQARAKGFERPPDVLVHSFGTWLVGQILCDEAARDPAKRELRFGRLILTGCVLRPDYSWRRIKRAGLVEEVLNHYGTKDKVVPLAHWVIRGSGPAGKRGFDPDRESGEYEVHNVRAEGYGHSDLFAVDRCVVNGTPHQRCPGAGRGVRHLEDTYTRVWRPFLTLPAEELGALEDRRDPPYRWRKAVWPLRGTLFPYLALPLLLGLVVSLLGVVGGWLAVVAPLALRASVVLAALVALYLLAVGVQAAWHRLRRRRNPV